MYKPLYILFLFIISIGSSKAQNLIYNGDFEIYDTCPMGLGIVGNAPLPSCLGWSSPTSATSDYYNNCADINNGVSVPINAHGNAFAYSGNGYSGIRVEFNGYWFEYIQGQTISELEQNETYHVSFWVHSGSYDTTLGGYHPDIALKSIGLYLSNTPISRFDYNPFNNVSPQIVHTGNYLTNTQNWIEISGNYTAVGGEKYLTIGYFCDTTNIDTIRMDFSVDNKLSYYFIDAVSITPVSKMDIPNVFTPNNDGINDEWFPVIKNMSKMEVVIFNRWGQEVFKGTKNNYKWDGTCGQELCPNGVYYYLITAEGSDGKKYNENGFIHLF